MTPKQSSLEDRKVLNRIGLILATFSVLILLHALTMFLTPTGTPAHVVGFH